MSIGMQLLIISLIVMFALASMLRRYVPAKAWQWQARVSFAFERGAAPDSLRARFGRALRPTITASLGGCSTSGCSSCNGCS